MNLNPRQSLYMECACLQISDSRGVTENYSFSGVGKIHYMDIPPMCVQNEQWSEEDESGPPDSSSGSSVGSSVEVSL